jgi:hypothetical protein
VPPLLFGRGLKTRLITNIAQSMVFSVFWKAIEVGGCTNCIQL